LHGIICFFTDNTFLIFDKSWLGDIVLSIMCAIICGIWFLIKYLFKKKSS
jgi:hypothetical protein